MIIVLILLGLCLGSFVNALVWRLHEQAKATTKKRQKMLSIWSGRSICPHCSHQLAGRDLIPVLSWLSLGGKCRYCRKPISVQYPLVEIGTSVLFVLSYIYWPSQIYLHSSSAILFGFWIIFLTGLIALAVYDIKWFLLPDKIVYPLYGLAVLQSVLILTIFGHSDQLASLAASFLIGGGLFWGLFQLSNGKWIGGGDVKLGGLLGLIVGTPGQAVLMIFTASLLGTLVSLPLILTGKARKNSHLPFGPFLIAGAIISYLFGGALIAWYKRQIGL